MKINVDIDRLVIAAVPGQRLDAARLKAAIEEELAALIGARGEPAGRDGGTRSVAAPARGEQREERTARELAVKIYGAMR